MQEEFTECLIKDGTVSLDFFFCYECVFLALAATLTSLFVLVGGIFKEIPEGCNEELLSFLESVGLAKLVSHMDIGIGENEVSWEEFNGILSEDFVLDHVRHLIVDKAVSFFVTGLNDQSLSSLNSLVNIDFLIPGRRNFNTLKIFLTPCSLRRRLRETSSSA